MKKILLTFLSCLLILLAMAQPKPKPKQPVQPDMNKMMEEATHLYQLASRSHPRDAMERLEVEMAKAELEV